MGTLRLQPSTSYKAMLSQSEIYHALGLATKHHTYDSVFYIHKEHGYKAYKYYYDGIDIRVGTINDSAAEAYTEAICVL